MSPKMATILLQSQPDQRLLGFTSNGSEHAFETLVERYRKPIQRYCNKLLPRAAAEDVVQQTFMSTWESLQKGIEIRNLSAWLYRTAHNKALDTVRKSGYEYEELGESLPSSTEPADQAANRTKINTAFSTLASLPERQREALVQTAVQGRSQDEVAYSLGVSSGAVRQLVSRARRSVRAAAAAFFPFPLIAKAAEGNMHGQSLAGSKRDMSGQLLAGRVRVLLQRTPHTVHPLAATAAIVTTVALLLVGQVDDGAVRVQEHPVDVAAATRSPAAGTSARSLARAPHGISSKTSELKGVSLNNPTLERPLASKKRSVASSKPGRSENQKSNGTSKTGSSATSASSQQPAASNSAGCYSNATRNLIGQQS